MAARDLGCSMAYSLSLSGPVWSESACLKGERNAVLVHYCLSVVVVVSLLYTQQRGTPSAASSKESVASWGLAAGNDRGGRTSGLLLCTFCPAASLHGDEVLWLGVGMD